jgi:hypothetical protein
MHDQGGAVKYDVQIAGSLLHFSIEVDGDREAVNTALRIATEQHRDVRVFAGERLIAATFDERTPAVDPKPVEG